MEGRGGELVKLASVFPAAKIHNCPKKSKYVDRAESIEINQYKFVKQFK